MTFDGSIAPPAAWLATWITDRGGLEAYAGELQSIFIVSQADLQQDATFDDAFQSDIVEGLSIRVTPAEGKKCERCWIHVTSVGADQDHPTLCNRCSGVMAVLPEAE